MRNIIRFAAGILVLCGAAAHAQDGATSEVNCRFRGEDGKHPEFRECRVRATFARNERLKYTVRCEDDKTDGTIYRGPFGSSSLSVFFGPVDINEGGVTIVAAERKPERFGYPVLKFDAFTPTLEGISREFEDVDARLYLDEDEFIRGTCDSEIFASSPPVEPVAPVEGPPAVVTWSTHPQVPNP